MEAVIEEPKSYYLSLEQLQQQPGEIREYKYGDTVTRENFLSLLIKSFTISRGRMYMQFKFFDWIMFRYGFNFKKTFENIKAVHYKDDFSGYIEMAKSFFEGCLSEKERDYFFFFYKRISKHQGTYTEIYRGISDMIEYYLKDDIDHTLRDYYFDIDSETAFIKAEGPKL